MIIKLLAVLHDIYKHFLIYSLRTAFLQVTITIGGSYLLSWLFRGILVSSGFPGLSIDNIFTFFDNPITFLLLLFYLIVLAFLVFLEFSFLVEMLRYKEIPIDLGIDRFKADFKGFLHSLRGRHFLSFLGYLILTIPVLRFFFSSALIERLYIPTFITGELQKSQIGQIGLIIGYTIVFYINLRLIYTLPLTVINQKQTFSHNLKTSWQMTKGRSFLTLLGLGFIAGLITLISFITSSLLLAIIYFGFWGNGGAQLMVQTLLLSGVWLIIFIASLLIKLGSVAYLVLNLEQANLVEVKPTPRRQKSRLLRLILLNLGIAVSAFLYNANQISNGDPEHVAIIAHRGFVEKGVENSIEALEASKKAGADKVEMDIMMTADRQLVVSHDDDLSRLAGKSIKISQSKAKDIIGLPITQNGHKSHIVSLQTYVKKAKSLKMPLIIELKPVDNQKIFSKVFSQEAKRLQLRPQDQVMSLDLGLIEKVEKRLSQLNTGHVITFQFGNFATDKVDFYAIEEFSYTKGIAKMAHAKNKQLYIWTINTESQLETYLEATVDGIITDYPNIAKEQQKDLSNNPDYLDFVFRVLKLN